MRHGFKTWAERKAVELRGELALKGHEALPMRRLSTHLDLCVVQPSAIPDLPLNHILQLSGADESGWSALCMPAPSGHIIIYNPNHSPERQESDIAHEISHVVCKHRPEQIVQICEGVEFFGGYDEAQEEEAKWLGGCLQIPKGALVKALFAGKTDEQIAEDYRASLAMVRYRKNISGAPQIVRRAQTKKADHEN